VQVQRRASKYGVVMVAGQKIALGRDQVGKTLTIAVTKHRTRHRLRRRTPHRPAHH
jgi:ribosomal protein L21